LVVTVTAADGETSTTYTVTLNVALSSNVELGTFTVNGADVADGDVVELEYGTTSVDYLAEVADTEATIEVSGGSDLVSGENTLTVTVTAPNGDVAVYVVTLMVAFNSDASLAIFSVNGEDVADGSVVDLEFGATNVAVIAEATDADAKVEIEGDTNLVPGENTLTVTVTAANGDVAVYEVTLMVALNSDTTLGSLTVNGVNVEDEASIELPAYTTDVLVVATPNAEGATVEIDGADALEAGDNTITVTVTAPNGDTRSYKIFVKVLLSAQTGVSSITVGGQAAEDGDVIRTTDTETTEIDVEVVTVDENAQVEVTGNTDLVVGDNLITILVTAPSGATREYKITYRIGGLPGSVRLKSLAVAGQSINFDLENPVVNLPVGTKSAAVVAITEELSSTAQVFGNRSLVTGSNTVTVRVTATDAVTVRDYIVTVIVAAPSSEKRLVGLKLNGLFVAAGSVNPLPAGTGSVNLIGIPYSEEATVTYTGTTGLVTGENTAVARVTAADGTYVDYAITLVVSSLSGDTSLSRFTIEGANVLGKTKALVIPGTRKLHIHAVATSLSASVKVQGYDVVPGVNDLTVTVTAANGNVQVYLVKVIVS